MAHYTQHVSTLKTPQSAAARADQVENSAGGFVFELDCWARLDRWLILGAEGGTYYATEQKLVRENAKAIVECLEKDGPRTVARIVEISEAGRAPKNDPAIFALAMAAAADRIETRRAAFAALPRVCRIGTHLYQFTRDVGAFRRWGRGLRRAVAGWYTERPADRLAYDVVKYRARVGWSHRDLVRLSHPEAPSPGHAALLRYLTRGEEATAATEGLFGPRDVSRRKADKAERVARYDAVDAEALPRIVCGYELAKSLGSSPKELVKLIADYGLTREMLPTEALRQKDGYELAKSLGSSPKELVKLIADYGLTREMLPTEALRQKEVWEALFQKMPMTALIRNLAKMTEVGLIGPMSDVAAEAARRITNPEALRKARVHPIQLLMALLTYKAGHGQKGKLTWTPVREIVDALDAGFYAAFAHVEPTGQNTLLGIDVSGSMDGGVVAGCQGLTPRIAAAAMAMVTAKSESKWAAVGFTSSGGGYGGRWGGSGNGLTPIDISPRERLDDICKKMAALPMGGTDCALPIVYATQADLKVDAFVIYTDNETWAGSVHPFQALRTYRQKSGRKAKLAVVGFTATEFSIADPKDAGMLDFVGFDAAAPAILADFFRGGPPKRPEDVAAAEPAAELESDGGGGDVDAAD